MKTILDVIDADQGRIAKLPAWARQLIESLVLNLTEANRKIAELSEGPADSNVRVDKYGLYPDRPLGKNTHVVFGVPDGEIEISHDRQQPGVLNVHSSGRIGHGALHVTPSASNSVKIRLGEY